MTDNIEGSKFIYTDNNQATKITEGAVTFQRLKGNPVHYPSMPDGKTVRVNVNAGGFINRQVHTWKDPGVQFIWTPKDSRNAEFTIYYRTTNPVHPHTNSVTKMRGGIHKVRPGFSSDPRASTFELSIKIGISELKSSKEYDHPHYVFANTTKVSNNQSKSDKWMGRKTIVWNKTDGTVYAEDWVDWHPFNANGKPRNHWIKLQSQTYKASGNYNKAPTWGGMFTSRTDGHNFVDVSIVSLREIIPPTHLSSTSRSKPMETEGI